MSDEIRGNVEMPWTTPMTTGEARVRVLEAADMLADTAMRHAQAEHASSVAYAERQSAEKIYERAIQEYRLVLNEE